MKRTVSLLLALVLMTVSLPLTAGAASSGLNILDTPRTYATYDETEDNDYMSAADRFDADQAQVYGEVGSVADGDTADWFAFTISGPRRLYLYGISCAGGYGTTCFSLMDTDGGVIRYANQLGVSEYGDDVFEIEIDLEPGTYYIQVTDPYNWVEYGFSTELTPLLDTPRVTASNRNTDGKIKLSWNAVSGAGCYYILRADNVVFINPSLFYTYDTSYADTTAEAGTTYYYKVYASSVDPDYLNSMYCAAVKRTCDLPRPAGVKITRDTSTGKNKITWNKVKGADKYSVYYSVDGGSTYSLLKTVTGTSLTHTSAPLGKTCYYKVKAVYSADPAANSAYSSSVNGTALCSAPSVTVSNVASTGKIKISWNAVSGASRYTLQIYDAGGTLLKTTNTTATSITHTSAAAGQTYTYKVKAVGSVSGTDSAYSAAKSCTCDLPAPSLTVSTTAAGKPRLTWNKISGATGYKVYCSTDGGSSWTLLKTTTGTALTHTSAQSGTTYQYKVMAAASVSDANSAYSAVGSVCTPSEVLAAPTLTVTANSSGKPRLTWNAVTGATGYKVYCSTDGGSGWMLLKSMTGTVLTHTSAQSGTTYSYKVMAVASDPAENSPYSSIRSLTCG